MQLLPANGGDVAAQLARQLAKVPDIRGSMSACFTVATVCLADRPFALGDMISSCTAEARAPERSCSLLQRAREPPPGSVGEPFQWPGFHVHHYASFRCKGR